MPDIETVTRWDEQTCSRLSADELGNASSEIPIVIYYNRCGQVRTVGAETLRESVEGRLWTRCGLWRNGWSLSLLSCLGRIFIFTSRFKLHLLPFPEASKHIGDKLPSLPADKSCVNVIADFFSASDENLWSSVDKKIRFVLTHRDGWQGYQRL